MTVAEWLDSREPSPPSRLAERLRSVLGDRGTLAKDLSPAGLAQAGIALLRAIEERESNDRSNALDLLAADALVTYAFEAAANSTVELRETANLTLELLHR